MIIYGKARFTEANNKLIIGYNKNGYTAAKIVDLMPRFSYKQIKDKLERIRQSANNDTVVSINYRTCRIEPLEDAKFHFGSRLKALRGGYYLDGKKILIGDLIRAANCI